MIKIFRLKKLKIIITVVFATVLLPALLLPIPASAQETTSSVFSSFCSREGGLGTCIANIYTLSLGLAALLAVFMIVLAGYKYMTAHGNASQTQDAKDHVTSALIGLLIIFTAFILLSVINPDLVRFRGDFSGLVPLPGVEVYNPSNPVASELEIVDVMAPLSARLMSRQQLSVTAAAPAGQELSYRWTVISDETGSARISEPDRQYTYLELWWQNQDTAEDMVGRSVTVRIEVSDLYGTDIVSEERTVTISGVIYPPVPVITGNLGSPGSRLSCGGVNGCGVSVNGWQSEPGGSDSLSYSTPSWGIGRVLVGRLQTNEPVIHGSGTWTASYIFRGGRTEDLDIEIVFMLEKGLHQVTTTQVAYLGP